MANEHQRSFWDRSWDRVLRADPLDPDSDSLENHIDRVKVEFLAGVLPTTGRAVEMGCGSARLDPSSGGEDIDTDEGALLELDGDLVRVRSPETGVVQRQVELVDAPSALARLGAAEGVWYLAANPGGRLELHVYDATGGRTLATRVRTFDFGTRATGVAGLYAAGSRVWLLARGGDYGSATLVELRLE